MDLDQLARRNAARVGWGWEAPVDRVVVDVGVGAVDPRAEEGDGEHQGEPPPHEARAPRSGWERSTASSWE
jgi:hypothetical protein